METFLKA